MQKYYVNILQLIETKNPIKFYIQLCKNASLYYMNDEWHIKVKLIYLDYLLLPQNVILNSRNHTIDQADNISLKIFGP